MLNPTGSKLALLSADDIKAIHRDTLAVLEETGVHIDNDRALGILRKAGADINYESKIAKFPFRLVMDAVDRNPSCVTLCGRDPKNDLVLEGNRVYTGSGGRAVMVLDPDTRLRRKANLADLVDLVRLIDSLDNIHFCIHPVHPADVSLDAWEVNSFYHALNHTTKHNMGGPGTRDALAKVIRMAEIITGGADKLRARPIISVITNTISPLKFDPNYVDILLDAVIYGLPTTAAPAPVAGSTAPVTLAGTLVQQNAESLAGVVLAQSANPGVPFLYGAVPANADMRNLNFLFGSMEMAMLNASAVQMAKYYNLPIYASAGVSDSKLPDIQAGYEKAMSTLMVALAGGNYIHLSAGLLDGGLTVAYEQYVIDNEINGNVLRALRGIKIDEERLAKDVIGRVGPGGNYLAEEHTVKYMRKEFYQPLVANRNNYTGWETGGSLDLREQASRKARDLLANHKSPLLPEEIRKQIKEEIPGIVE